MLFFLGKDQYNQKKLIILPEYNSPKCKFMGDNYLNSNFYKGCHFFYHDENYIVCYTFPQSKSYIKVLIRKRNGDVHQNLKIYLKAVQDNSYIKFSLSPNGRYMFYCEHETEELEEIAKDNHDDYYSYHNTYKEYKPTSPSLGKIVELVIDHETKEFKHVCRRTIHDFDERYKFTAYDFNRYYYSYNQNENEIYSYDHSFYVTDKMELI